jgi:PAS domain S-box-containing protein
MFSTAFRSSPVGIVIWRIRDGSFLNVNESFTKISGFSKDSVTGRTLDEVGLLHSMSDYHRMIQMLQEQGQVRGFETEFITSSAELRMVTISAEMIMLSDEPCMIATIEDVTEKKTLEREILNIGERERQMIGQDLHDDLAPHLIGIEVMSELLKKKLQENKVPAAGEIEKIRILIEQAIQKTRRLSRGLCPVFLADHGLESLLQEMASNIEEVHGIACRFTYQRSIMIEDISMCTHIYYIVHEAIHNAIKHGRAQRISINLLCDDGRVTLVIQDDGSGMHQVENPQGMGLKIMKFRAHMIGADLLIDDDSGKGTKVVLSFQYHERENRVRSGVGQ